MKSIIQDDKKCFVCGKEFNLHLHHIIYGKNRSNSTKYGLVVYLCREHHIGNTGVHFNNDLDKRLKKIAQVEFEKTYKDLDFISIFRKNYK